ncbi:MAG: YceI family protein [Deltaproteobacteria bacterium]|nr:YceI family protein [Deltaproteobacteria bacterium]
MKSTTLAVATLIAVPAFSPEAAHAASPATTWAVDASHSSAQFRVRHLMVSNVKGELGPVQGVLELHEKDLSKSRVSVKIDARKLDTRDAKRDEHLRSADFLNVEAFPFVTFESTKVLPLANGRLEVTGNLTIRNVTHPVTLNVDPLPTAVKDPWGNTKRGATASATINRKDWGLVWNMALETGGVVVGESVEISLEVELVQQVKPAV